MERRSPRRSWRRPLIWLACVFALVMLCGAYLTFVSFSAPLETERTDIGMTIGQRGTYAWTAALTPNHLYEDQQVSGETTIFTSITRALNMEFSYQMNALGAQELHGTYAIDLIIGAGQNWSKRMQLIPPRAFTAQGGTATFWAPYTLDIAKLTELVDEIEEETGVTGGPYTLTIQPSVDATATGKMVSDQTFAAPFEMIWSGDRRVITMPQQREFISQVELPVVTQVPATLPVLSFVFPVSQLRVGAGAATGIALLLTAAMALLARRYKVERTIDVRRLKRAHARLFVEARSELPPTLPTVEVSDLGQLIRVARETGKPVVHLAAGDVHYVVDSGVVYISGQPTRVAAVPHPAIMPRRQRREAAAEV